MNSATMTEAMVAANKGDFLSVVKLTSGSYASDVWAAAMAAHFGPNEIHKAYLAPNGTPSVEALAMFPHIAERMADAAEKCVRLIAWYLRDPQRLA